MPLNPDILPSWTRDERIEAIRMICEHVFSTPSAGMEGAALRAIWYITTPYDSDLDEPASQLLKAALSNGTEQ